MLGVKYRGQLVRVNHLVDRAGYLVVKVKTLHRRIKLEAIYAALLDQALRLTRPALPLCGSMLAKAIIMSLFSFAAAAIS